jgi:small GTP-binding protein
MYFISYKYILIGDSGVGKTSILTKCTMNEFTKKHSPTIGVDFGTKIAKVGEQNYKLYIWDTAGQEIYKTITKSYYKNSNCVILVYDITNRQSFINLPLWLSSINNIVKDTVMILVGNKKDAENKRQISFIEGLNEAKKHNMYFMELSAMDYNNVEKLIYNCLNILIDKNEVKYTSTNNYDNTKRTRECCNTTNDECCIIL